ncbi:MAG: hypothetical protein QF435_17010, partial [Arenicellales bacterium]|nr:hypothetical protein [Arenicellales bacterium]
MVVLGNEVDDETHAGWRIWGGYRRAAGTGAVVVPRHGDGDLAGGSGGDDAATTGWQHPCVGLIPVPA